MESKNTRVLRFILNELKAKVVYKYLCRTDPNKVFKQNEPSLVRSFELMNAHGEKLYSWFKNNKYIVEYYIWKHMKHTKTASEVIDGVIEWFYTEMGFWIDIGGSLVIENVNAGAGEVSP